MNPDPCLCIGIRSSNEAIEIATLEAGRGSATMSFPATGMGIAAIKAFLSASDDPVRLAITGVAALSVALALGSGPRGEIFIVSPSIADHPAALAQYAGRFV